MVWFQCEDCGENLKKPKLQNHFWKCSASQLSCIDCGEIFGQESVQGHTQCITEAEKYGPKGQGKALNGNTARPQSNTKQKPEVDVNVGLSECPPWFCSLCNSKATSKQTLLLHADGKKHRAKARAFHASKQQPKQAEESAPNGQVSSENNQDEKLSGNVDTEQQKSQNPPKVDPAHNSFEAGNGSLLSSKKRKHEASKTDSTREMAGGDISGEIGHGEVIQVERAVEWETKCKVKKPKQHVTGENEVLECMSTKEDAKKRIKWKKLIKSALKSNPDNVLKMRKLRKLVLEAITQSGFAEDEGQLSDMLEQKINSSSRFTVQGKYVYLVGKN